MRDVKVNARFPGYGCRRRDRHCFGVGRPRFEKVVVGEQRPPKRGKNRRIFGVDCKRQAELRDHRREAGQRAVIGGRFEVGILDAR